MRRIREGMVSPRLAATLLVALTLAAWGAVPWGTFHFDDYHNLVLDRSARESAALRERMVERIRPLLRLSYAFDYRLWGMTPKGFLATNLALHVVTVTGVWLLARRRLASEFGALIAAGVFALQPANAEVVAYVSGRSTGLMAALLVWGLVCHETAHARHGSIRSAWRAASLGLCVAACLAKEVALIFPALLALWEWTRHDACGRREDSLCFREQDRVRATANRPGPETRQTLLAAIFVACVVLAALFTIPRYRELAAFSLGLRSPLASLATNARAVPVMLSLWTRPWALSVDHTFGASGTPAEIATGAALIAALVAAAIAVRRRAPIAT
ncbi:MAG: hypothetical protein GW878_01935, partial [Acidobacteria bacterium]|nr:hypothetical protein [Acidobacteriota bacterium]